MYLENLGLPGKPGWTWKTWVFLENLGVPGKPGFTWKTLQLGVTKLDDNDDDNDDDSEI